MKRIVVVGASLAGHQAAHALRNLGYDGRLTVVGAEAHRPYDRYPLSKDFLTGKLDRAGLHIGPLDLDVEWRLGVTALGLDLAARRVATDRAGVHHFDGLVVATGARPRDASVAEGVRGAFVMRTIEDGMRLRAALAHDQRRIVIIGGGLVGAELASAAVAEGHDTTLVDASPVPTARALGPTVATHIRALHEARGVRLVVGRRLRHLDIDGRRVTGVALTGNHALPADLVVLATGTQPNTEWLRGSGLTLDDGLVCRPTLHALGSDVVVGIGDVARVVPPVLGGATARFEHWASTREQAAVAADNLLRGPGGRCYDALPEFGTTLHGAKLRVAGFPAMADGDQVLAGSVEHGSAVVALLRDRQLVGVLTLNPTPQLRHVAAAARAWLGKPVLDCQQSTISVGSTHD